ncbi:hypothetical protein [Dyadobacter tibetensis]|uniref:hypothetical protein n=1 Tax=Dyadobacter tibetensis TaxID=1211851 RepID=UPI0004721A0A|nr:hypothetical protein [Dyadobacter tibetensis]
METSILFKSALLIISLLITIFLWVRASNPLETDRSATANLILVALVLLTFLSRYCYMSDVEPNVDTSTWLASTLSLSALPDKLWLLLNYTDSRPLTVLPIWLSYSLGAPLTYTMAEIVGLIFWLISIVFFYRSLCLFIHPSIGLLLVWSICLLIGTTSYNDHIAYNSEHLSILVLTMCSYGYLKMEKTGSITIPAAVLLGGALGSLLYIKFQNVPMGLVIAGMSLISIIQLKKWSTAMLFILSGLMPTILINIYFLAKGKLNDFWVNYFWNYFYYSYSTQFQSMPVEGRFNPFRIFSFILYSSHSRFFFIGLLLALLVVSIWRGTTFKRSTDFSRTNKKFAALMLLSSLYACLQAGNNFGHYVLYLFIPLAYLVAVMIGRSSGMAQLIGLGLVMSFSFVQSGRNIVARQPLQPLPSNHLDHEITSTIVENSKPGQPIVIWGWADRFYYFSKRPSGYRLPHTHNLFLESDLKVYRIKNFLEDLDKTRPILFADAVTPSLSTMSDIGYRFEHNKKVRAYINKHYRYLKNVNGMIFYKRIQ